MNREPSHPNAPNFCGHPARWHCIALTRHSLKRAFHFHWPRLTFVIASNSRPPHRTNQVRTSALRAHVYVCMYYGTQSPNADSLRGAVLADWVTLGREAGSRFEVPKTLTLVPRHPDEISASRRFCGSRHAETSPPSPETLNS